MLDTGGDIDGVAGLALRRFLLQTLVRPVAVIVTGVLGQDRAEMPLAEAYDYAANVMVENMLARDAEEGIGAFLEKRKPEWTGN